VQQEQHATPQMVAPPEHPDEPARRAKRAEHEAGHAVVGDDVVGEVLWVNISKTNGLPWEAEIKWPGLDIATEAEVNVLGMMARMVAGPVAKKAIAPEARLVSEMITQGNLDGTDRHYESVDVRETARLMMAIGWNTKERVLQAEEKARQILDKRKDHLKALAKALYDHQFVEGEVLKRALGKEGA